MNTQQRFLKMRTPADMLAIHFFASSGQLEGRFVQETSAPWAIWWQLMEQDGFMNMIGSMLKSKLQAPETMWSPGIPSSDVTEVSWIEVFKKSIVRSLNSKPVAEEVIVTTEDIDTFYEIVRNHFVLQQGEIHYSISESQNRQYLLKIKNPSLWVFNTVKKMGSFTWYNKLKGHSGIYLQSGSEIKGISDSSALAKFMLSNNVYMLINSNSNIFATQPSWKSGESVIKIVLNLPLVPQYALRTTVDVKPALRPTEKPCKLKFWKITDRERFTKILLNESLAAFRGYRAWFCDDGTIFIVAESKNHDRALASVLSDAFIPFHEPEKKVMLPNGYLLTPSLSSERIHILFSSSAADYICIEEIDDKIQATILPLSSQSNIEDFITLQVKDAVTTASAVKPCFNFSFVGTKKKKTYIEIKTQEASKKLEAASEDGQVGSGVSSKTIKISKSIFSLSVSALKASQISSHRQMIEAIDNQLNNNPSNSSLWKQRADMCVLIGANISALISVMNSAVIDNDISLLATSIMGFCQKELDFNPLISGYTSESEKGKILAEIRDPKNSAEIYFAMSLLYAARFDELDIYHQAVSGMKTGFNKENRSFYNFKEIRGATGAPINVENRVELLSLDDMPKIRFNLNKFMLQIGCCGDLDCIDIISLQLYRIFRTHLGNSYAQELTNTFISEEQAQRINLSATEISLPSSLAIANYFTAIIKATMVKPPHTSSRNSVNRWMRLMTMEKIKETPLKDFFTGDLYKAPFVFDLSQENHPQGLLAVAWLRDTASTLPTKSDGKMISRLIYERFSNGYNDWNNYFNLALKSNDYTTQAKSQRLLLLMVAEYGPHPEFEQYIMPANIQLTTGERWDIYRLTLYCDLYRLFLAYRKQMDEQKLFNLLVSRVPPPPIASNRQLKFVGEYEQLPLERGILSQLGWEDFKNSAEWIIMCLLLSSSPVRRIQLDNLAATAARWLRRANENQNVDMFAEALTIMSFLSIGILADLVPAKLEIHQLLEKRKVLWIQHAFKLDKNVSNSFKNWQSCCGF